MAAEPQEAIAGDLLADLVHQRVLGAFCAKDELLRFATTENRHVRVDLLRNRGSVQRRGLLVRVRFTDPPRHRVEDYHFYLDLWSRIASISEAHDDARAHEVPSGFEQLHMQLKPHFTPLRNLHRLMRVSALMVIRWHDQRLQRGV